VDIAVAVGIQAQKDGVAPKVSEGELRKRVLKTQWTPAYRNLSNGELR
jgi:malate dehydrogenase (oxaloacetate-decarboxylating)